MAMRRDLHPALAGKMAAIPPLAGVSEGRELTVALCGSFRREPERLQAEFRQLRETGCTVLSPRDVTFVEERDGFVLAEHERGHPPTVIEAGHLRAMQAADFVWLHAPRGYVGRTAAMELGFAHALGLRVFSKEQPDDVALGSLVEIVDSPTRAAALAQSSIGDAPARSIVSLQNYYRRAALARGWGAETAQGTLVRLIEEFGELAHAIRIHDRLHQDTDGDLEEAGLELADVQLYLVHLANILGIDLGAAVIAKEQINEERFGRRGEAAA